MSLGTAIKLVRTRRGMTQDALAQHTSLSPSYLSQLERDKRDPTISTVRKIACGLNVPVVVLIFLSDEIGTGNEAFGRELSEKISYLFLKDLSP